MKTPRTIVRRTAWPQGRTRAVGTPLQPSVVYAATDPDDLDRVYEEKAGYTYAREGHPNATVLAEKVNYLEGAAHGIVTGSGMSAVGVALLGLLRAGDHIIGADQLYGRSLRLMTQELPRLGISAALVDPTDAAAVRAAIGPRTRAILVEVVSNPTLRVADMEGISAIAREHGLTLIVDNTFTTPRLYRPLDHGAHVTIQSVTKLLAGHSDVTLGYVGTNDAALAQRMTEANVTWGLTPSPFDCWLAERGIQTFELRFDRAEATARALADALASAEGIDRVIYPTRPDHPDHNRAMALFGGRGGNMMSLVLKGGRAAANAFTRAAPEINFAPTLGDVGTTLSHPPSSSHRALTPEGRAALGITEGFFRVSVGLEDPALLIEEMTRAAAAAARA